MGNVCLKLFDKNGDGKATAQEVLKTVSDVLKMIGFLTNQAAAITKALQEAGIDIKQAGAILNAVNQAVATADELTNKMEQIKIPKSLDEIGDVNKDGKIDKEDLVSYLSASKEICDTLIKKGIKVELISDCRTQIQNAIDAVKLSPKINIVSSLK